MKGNTFISVLAVIAMSAGIALAAQQQGGMSGQMGGQMGGRMGRMSIDQRVARMKSDLNLSDTQTSKVKDLFEKQQQEMQDWRSSHQQASPAEIRAHRRDMMAEMNGGLKKILTPEQYKKQQAMMQQEMRRGMRRGPQGPPQN